MRAVIPAKLVWKSLIFTPAHMALCERVNVCSNLIPARRKTIRLPESARGWRWQEEDDGAKGKRKHATGASFSVVAKVLCFLPLTCFTPPVLPGGDVGALSLDCRAATRAFLPAGRGISTRLLFVSSSLPVLFPHTLLFDCSRLSWMVWCCLLLVKSSWIFLSLPLECSSWVFSYHLLLESSSWIFFLSLHAWYFSWIFVLNLHLESSKIFFSHLLSKSSSWIFF